MNGLAKAILLVSLGFGAGCRAAEPRLDHKFEFINNGKVCVGVDMNAGGAIAFLSTGSQNEQDNWVNIHDLGRYIQQCYYAGEKVDRRQEGQHERFSPWKWNPIQAGSIGCTLDPPHPNAHSEVLEFEKEETSLYLKCVPRLWDMPGETPECFFEQWIWLEEGSVRVRNKVTVARTDDIWGEGELREQEMPSIYPIARLRDGYTYTGNAPWTSDAVVKMPDNPEGYDPTIPPTQPGGFPWNRFDATEHWMAYVNPQTGIGFGVYNPSATARWVCGFFQGGGAKGDGPYSDTNCFIGPLKWMKLKMNDTFEYEYYLILGTVEDVRRFAYEKEGQKLKRDHS